MVQILIKAIHRRVSHLNTASFLSICKKSVYDSSSTLEFFTAGVAYTLLGMLPDGSFVLHNNYSTPLTIGGRNSNFFKTHFTLVDK
jgi:hypothetical protein